MPDGTPPAIVGGTLPALAPAELITFVARLPVPKTVSKPFLNMTLSAPAGYTLSDAQWRKAIRICMEKLGYPVGAIQWIAFRHSDTGCDHIHVFIVPMTATGRWIGNIVTKRKCDEADLALSAWLGVEVHDYFDPRKGPRFAIAAPKRRLKGALVEGFEKIKVSLNTCLPGNLNEFQQALDATGGGIQVDVRPNKHGQESFHFSFGDAPPVAGGSLSDELKPRNLRALLQLGAAIRFVSIVAQLGAFEEAMSRLRQRKDMSNEGDDHDDGRNGAGHRSEAADGNPEGGACAAASSRPSEEAGGERRDGSGGTAVPGGASVAQRPGAFGLRGASGNGGAGTPCGGSGVQGNDVGEDGGIRKAVGHHQPRVKASVLRTIWQAASSLKFAPKITIRPSDGSVRVSDRRGGRLRVFADKIVTDPLVSSATQVFRDFTHLLSEKLGMPVVSKGIAPPAKADTALEIARPAPSSPRLVPSIPVQPRFTVLALHPNQLQDSTLAKEIAARIGGDAAVRADLASYTPGSADRPLLVLTAVNEKEVIMQAEYWDPYLNRLRESCPGAIVTRLSMEGSLREITMPLAAFIADLTRRRSEPEEPDEATVPSFD
jgi:hypothetical protein